MKTRDKMIISICNWPIKLLDRLSDILARAQSLQRFQLLPFSSIQSSLNIIAHSVHRRFECNIFFHAYNVDMTIFSQMAFNFDQVFFLVACLGSSETSVCSVSELSSRQSLLSRCLSHPWSINEYKKIKLLQANRAKFWKLTCDGLTTHPGVGRVE